MRILLIDDHLLFGECLRSATKDTATIILAKDISRACELIDANPLFDLVLLDLFLQNENSLTFFNYLKKLSSPPPVLVLTGKGTQETVEKSKQAGAKGLIHKSKHVEQVLEAIIEIVKHGRECWPDGDYPKAPEYCGADPIAQKLGVTLRQHEVLINLGRGLSNKEIAEKLGITEATVKSHVTVLFQTLAVKNRNACVHSARKIGLLE